MNKALLYGIGGLVVLAGVGFFVFRPMGWNMMRPSITQTSGTLKELLSSSVSQKCEFTHKLDTSESSGIVYVSGGHMRGDFTSTVGGRTMGSHMIISNNTSYVWTDGQETGFQIAMNKMMEAQSQSPKEQSVDINQKLNYSCSGWSGDNAQFTLPAGVKFQDLNAMMGGELEYTAPTGGAGANVKAMQCTACNSAPEPSRSQCRAALGCN